MLMCPKHIYIIQFKNIESLKFSFFLAAFAVDVLAAMKFSTYFSQRSIIPVAVAAAAAGFE